MRNLLLILLFPLAAAGQPMTFADPAWGGKVATPIQSFTYYSVVFDGSNDRLTNTTLTGLSDGKIGTVSFWIKTAGDGTNYIIINTASSTRFSVIKSTEDNIDIRGAKADGTTILRMNSNSDSVETADGWVHVAACWDLATTGARHIMINGVEQTTVTTFTDDTIQYNTGWFTVGAISDNGLGKFAGSLCEFWFTTEYIDVTQAANLQKFRSAGGKPVNLGTDGSLPTGTAPLLYLRKQAPDWEQNQGSGGGMSEVGTLDDGGTDKP